MRIVFVGLGIVICLTLAQRVLGQEFYPLKAGNTWYYRDIVSPPNDSTIASSVKIVGDSLLPNGLRYYVLSGKDIAGGRFIRSDSAYVYYFNEGAGEDQRFFALKGKINDTLRITWGAFSTVKLARIDSAKVFGVSSRILSFELEGTLFAVVKLCENYGPMVEWRYADPPPPWPDYGRELVGGSINGKSFGNTLGVSEPPAISTTIALLQNFPNPFNPRTTIRYDLSQKAFVKLAVYDILGREVAVLVNSEQETGNRETSFDASGLASGVYFYRLTAGSYAETRRLVILK